MPAEEIIRARIEASPAAVSVSGRVYAGRAPQNAPVPYIVWQRVSGATDHALDGRTDIARGRFQVDCYAATYAEALALSRTVAAALETNDADLHAERDGDRDIYDEDTPKFFRRSVDFLTVERII